MSGTARQLVLVAAITAKLCSAAVAQTGMTSGSQAIANKTEASLAISESEADLRKRVTLAGQPKSVVWTVQRVGPDNPDSFPPGPTDEELDAVLTYASAGEVAEIVGDGLTEEVQLPTPAWFPASLNPGQSITAVRHHGVEGFMNATVLTTPAAPEVIILHKAAS